MKKPIITMLVGIMVLSFGLPVMAASNSNVVYDNEKKSEKVFSPQKLDSGIGITATGKLWSANVDIWNPVTGHVRCKATSKSTYNGSNWAIDYIYAKARAYKNGTLEASASDDAYNSSYVGALAITDDEGWGWAGYGNHKFQKAGYQSYYPETYDNSY